MDGLSWWPCLAGGWASGAAGWWGGGYDLARYDDLFGHFDELAGTAADQERTAGPGFEDAHHVAVLSRRQAASQRDPLTDVCY
ncbi:hypothetical protein GCM10010411_41710 [Actinomadura fulvescens]|uniref:Uncharacterized protein n=1 Tax=Actinomadura fulvescens TaxID=46160 RepID=A0ABP6C5J7_9ACTN